jgi:hypothetical protein
MADGNPLGNRHVHLNDEQLAAWQDGERAPVAREHLESCPDCAERLRTLQQGVAAYREYDDALCAALPPPPRQWASLDELIAAHSARRRLAAWRWWPVPALAAAALLVGVFWRERPARQVSEMLEQSARVELPANRVLAVRFDGRTLLRPAVLVSDGDDGAPALARLRQAFNAANYSWREPLSPRSFQAWRGVLRHKRDSVSFVEEQGRKISYRVRTESADGSLHSVALTLRATDLRAIGAAFDFAGQAPLEMSDAPAPRVSKPPVEDHPVAVETRATPEDALRVLAALDALGVAADEPISVGYDTAPGHIVVRASGLSDARRRQIEAALAPLPRVSIRWDAVARPAPPSTTEKYASAIPVALRQRFEDQLGGPAALEEATDRALDASSSALAQAHRLRELAELFPVEVEARFEPRQRAILRRLERGHRVELARLVSRVHVTLGPVLPAHGALAPDNESGRPWQTAAPAWLGAAQQLDRLANRLLAGAYSQSSGEEMIQQLSLQISTLEHALAKLARDDQ